MTRVVALALSRHAAAATLAVVAMSCGGDAATPDAPALDAATDAVVDSSPVMDAGLDAPDLVACGVALPAIAMIGDDEPVREDPACEVPPRRPVPTTGCFLDLSAHTAGSPGTCGAEVAAGTTADDQPSHPIEISEATQLPIVIELPAAPGLDPACPALCDVTVPSDQVFGIHFALTRTAGNSPFVHIRVEPPWRVVSGNEGAPSLCDNGRPTIPEHYSPCVFTYVNNIAFVTDDPNAPAARAIIEADDVTSNAYSGCCLYP